MTTIRARVVVAALSVAFGSVGAAQSPSVAPPSKRMLDGKQWTTENLNATSKESYCYDNSEQNCRRYGRLYTWDSAQKACRALSAGWRLPTNEEWRRLASHYGGIRQESADLGKAAYTALITGGSSGFNAVYGGGRTDKSGEYLRLEAHSTGRPPNRLRTARGSTTSAKAGSRSAGTKMARSFGRSRCAV
jgi:uncharacterized protein (TIGR02145 family)